MNLTQILQPEYIKVPLQSRDKESAIAELVDLLNSQNRILDREAALNSVLIREKTRSTGIGSGIAIPHGKCKGVKELVIAIGIARDPIDFYSIDGKPVSIIILLLSPLDQTGPHIQALAGISKLMLDTQFKNSLEKAQSAQHLYDLIRQKETS